MQNINVTYNFLSKVLNNIVFGPGHYGQKVRAEHIKQEANLWENRENQLESWM